MRLRDIERERGDLHQIIPHLVNEQGQHATARQLGVSVSTINNWLMRNGYILKRQYIREETLPEYFSRKQLEAVRSLKESE